MPRLTALRIAALRDLADQLRYAPRERLRKELLAAVALAGELDPELNYPEDWVVHRITGYRPEIEAPATIVGGALLSELSALVERISAEAGFTEHAVGGGAASEAGLADRGGVSRKTIERFRRRGLVAHRVRDEGGRARLAFSAEAVEVFERIGATEIARAAGFKRIGGDEEARLYAVGARAARRFGWSLNEAT